jgi:hypothetical protein
MSFISDYNKPCNIHQTHGVFILPSTTNCSKIQQIISRLFGNHGDDINFEIYATNNSIQKFLLSFELHDQEIKELISLSQNGNNVVCSDFLNNRIMMKNRYPKKYTEFATKTEPTPILIRNPNEKKEKKILKEEEITCIKLLTLMEPEKYNKIEKHFVKEDPEPEIFEGEDSWILVKLDKLSETDCDIYARIIEIMKNEYKNKIVSKSSLLYKLTNNDKKEKERLNNITWHWHPKNDHIVSENHKGLLFKLDKNIWNVKYN